MGDAFVGLAERRALPRGMVRGKPPTPRPVCDCVFAPVAEPLTTGGSQSSSSLACGFSSSLESSDGVLGLLDGWRTGL